MSEIPLKTATELQLVPPNTVVEADGEGAAFELDPAGPRIFVCQLNIREVIEQESLGVSLWGSSDGADWDSQPILKLPQRFYTGNTPMVFDLRERPEVKFVRARWEVNRWGRGRPLAWFKFDLRLEPAQRD
ncbi:MAG: hypothetical protein ACE5H2_05415 [Terriglobia bacterium]